MEFFPCEADIGDDVGHVTKYGGVEEQSADELRQTECVAYLRRRRLQLTHRRKTQRAQVHRVQVGVKNIVPGRPIGIGGVGSSSRFLVVAAYGRRRRENVDETGVPVIEGEQRVKQGHRPNEVGEVRVSLGPIEKIPEPVRLQETTEPQRRPNADPQVEHVERQEGETVDAERGRVHVVTGRLRRVSPYDAVSDVTGPKVQQHVEQVARVGGVVETEPDGGVRRRHLVEAAAEDDRPEVVDEGAADDRRPPERQATGRIEDRPLDAATDARSAPPPKTPAESLNVIIGG